MSPWRWAAIVLFVVATSLNYLDRQLLAAAAPLIKEEYGLSNLGYGQLISAFSLVYAFATPLAGLLVDRIGLRLAAMSAVLLWSVAGAATALAGSFQALLACRVGLAVGESAGIPSSTKATATYLRSSELGLGTAAQSIGITVGMMTAPLLIASIAPAFGWRPAFVIAGSLGAVWTLVWFAVSRRVPAVPAPNAASRPSLGDVLADRRLWGVAVANALVMTVYSLWTNWTTIYFVQEHQLTAVAANQQFAWIPPVFATLGGFCGGWLAYRRITAGGDGVSARLRICQTAAPVLLVTAAIPHLPSPGLAAAAMALSFFGCLVILNNMQMIPIDVFGSSRAGFCASMLTCSFALMQAVVSPAIGALIDSRGFDVVCALVSGASLLGVLVVTMALRRSSAPAAAHAAI